MGRKTVALIQLVAIDHEFGITIVRFVFAIVEIDTDRKIIWQLSFDCVVEHTNLINDLRPLLQLFTVVVVNLDDSRLKLVAFWQPKAHRPRKADTFKVN